MDDLSDSELLAFAQGELSPQARRRVELRLDRSPKDAAVVAGLVKMFGAAEDTVVSEGEPTTAAWGRKDEPEATLPESGQLGRYLLIGELGRGGMGVVHRAYDPKLQREVALKCLRPGQTSAQTHDRLIREAQAMAQLNHRNVVSVYDVELFDEMLTLAMEYVDGTNLAAWLRTRSHPWRRVLEVFDAAGRGLAAAHRAGLLHRDFKPTNVLVANNGDVKVTDFGIARVADNTALQSLSASLLGEDTPFPGTDQKLTEDGQIMGTPSYMPPEQLQAIALTPAADQYAFCVSLWEGLTGSLPFETTGSTFRHRELVALKNAGAPRWPSSASSVPRRIVDAIARGLSPAPKDRWPTMADLLLALRYDPTKRRRRILGISATAAVVVAAAGGHTYHRSELASACEAEGQRIAEIWNPTRAARVADAFAQTNMAYATETWERAAPQVEAFVGAWQRARTTACIEGELDGTRPAPMLARTRSCLDEQQAMLRTLAEQWTAPNETVVSRTAMA
ncbi:MAG: serine/threonine protein kinase, partial [Deltaproteobacteria bacterium]|nr:serine/threonine protein kinase [Deltaproteobacteria bacterium]